MSIDLERRKPVNVLFCCWGNSFRSQVAAGFAQAVCFPQLNISSAGLDTSLGFRDIVAGSEYLSSQQIEAFVSMSGQPRPEKTLGFFGLAYSAQTPLQLTPELIAKQNYVLCFTGRQLDKINGLANGAECRPQIALVTEFVGQEGELIDPERLIVKDKLDWVLEWKTIQNCFKAGEYRLGWRAMKDKILRRGRVVDRLDFHQARRIRACVVLAIDRIARESKLSIQTS